MILSFHARLLAQTPSYVISDVINSDLSHPTTNVTPILKLN